MAFSDSHVKKRMLFRRVLHSLGVMLLVGELVLWKFSA